MKDTWKNISQDHTVHINSCAKTELSSFWAHFIVKIHHRRDISCENNKLLMIFISFNVLSILCDVLLELGFTRFPFQGIYFCNEFFMYHINSRYHKKSFFVVVWMQNVLRFLYQYLNYYMMGRCLQFCKDLSSKYLMNKILVLHTLKDSAVKNTAETSLLYLPFEWKFNLENIICQILRGWFA